MLRPSFYFKDTYSDPGAVFPAQPFKFGLEHTRASDCRTTKSNRLALRFEVAKVGARLASLCEGLFRHESPGRRNGRMSDPRSQSVRRQRKYRVGVATGIADPGRWYLRRNDFDGAFDRERSCFIDTDQKLTNRVGEGLVRGDRHSATAHHLLVGVERVDHRAIAGPRYGIAVVGLVLNVDFVQPSGAGVIEVVHRKRGRIFRGRTRDGAGTCGNTCTTRGAVAPGTNHYGVGAPA